MNSFWIANARAKGPGFGMFTPTHFLFLDILAIIAIFIIRLYLKYINKRDKIRKYVAVTIVSLEIIKDIFLIVTGQFDYGDLPFHLCGMGIFIILGDAFIENKTTKELMYALTLWGAVAAILTPDWVTNAAINIFVWQSFLIHTLMITYVLMRLIAKDYQPQWKALWRSAVFVAIMLPLCMVLNHAWGTNFWFLETPVPGSPLEPIHQIFGNFYLLGLIVVLIIAWILLYTPWAIIQAKKTHKTSV
ncbi:MAG: TIGR02206 family membrane protein [Streptococcaceae bacterium]|nr:TIGR02206 family membrane protein [Streptococcaceae bacterium]MCL2681122.1 TIGR02206 family membrane protein [Streptococcaceae bacterium]MCL2858155.1 TIGR02206 family membrane protein [Streptococcaceae bacterium]